MVDSDFWMRVFIVWILFLILGSFLVNPPQILPNILDCLFQEICDDFPGFVMIAPGYIDDVPVHVRTHSTHPSSSPFSLFRYI